MVMETVMARRPTAPPPDWVPEAPTARIGRPRLNRPARTCERDECNNPVTRSGQRFCSYECRNIALRHIYSQRATERAKRQAADRESKHSEPVRQAFRLLFNKVPVSEWPPEIQAAYNEYIRQRRAVRRGPRPQEPVVSDEVRTAFQLLARGTAVADLPPRVYDAYTHYLTERRSYHRPRAQAASDDAEDVRQSA